jgi:hypothetical protein
VYVAAPPRLSRRTMAFAIIDKPSIHDDFGQSPVPSV